MNEAGFIAALRRFATHPGARGLDDDAAVLEIGGETLVLTHDSMVEGVHWLPSADPADIAHKLVATNLSDLAAKGAEPVGVLLGFTLGSDDYDARFAEAIGAVLERYRTPLLGGDTVTSDRKIVGLTAIGRATHVPVPSRSGARPGDGLFVCGTIGDAMIGHAALTGRIAGEHAECVARFLRPEPLLAEGRALAPVATAMMDVSDGLLLDASRLAQASRVTLAIERTLVPFSAAFNTALSRAYPDDPPARAALTDAALRWGDDYALLFTLPPHGSPPCSATRIGVVCEAGEAPLLLEGVVPPSDAPLGYLHR